MRVYIEVRESSVSRTVATIIKFLFYNLKISAQFRMKP